ncbi:hypothetical protein ACWGQ5_10295 [Streptomyces sp. NPDC055722]
MSYDPTVWEGERPAKDKTAGRIFVDLDTHYNGWEADEPPSMTAEASAHPAGLVQSMDVDCFDPQQDRLRRPS